MSWKQAYKKGLRRQKEGEYNFAIEYFQRALAKGGDKHLKGKIHYLIAENYRKSNRSQEAASHYGVALEERFRSKDLLFKYAFALKSKGKYEAAQNLFKRYIESAPASDKNIEIAKKEIKKLDKVYDIIKKKTNDEVHNAGSDINTEGPEYCPLYHNGKLIYTASNNQYQYTALGIGYSDIYTFEFDGFTKTSGVKKAFIDALNKNEHHEACAAVHPDEELVVFARSNDRDDKGPSEVNLYYTMKKEGEWMKPETVNFCDPDVWYSTPRFSTDGDTLYFSLYEEERGYGGTDLYKAAYEGNGNFGAVQNMGPEINTYGNEIFPTPRGDKFYFSSDGHPTIGNLDVFVAQKDQNNKTIIHNLGQPINSQHDDFALTFKEADKGYYTSNRPGGKGMDDIYTFEMKEVPKEYTNFLNVHLFTYNADSTKKPLNNVYLKAVPKNSTDTIINDTLKRNTYTFKIDTNKAYVLKTEKEGYLGHKEEFYPANHIPVKSDTTNGYKIKNTYYKELFLDTIEIGKEIVLDNIYYDFDKATIRDSARKNLNYLVNLLKDNPKIKVELGAHTDSRGSKEYNKKLSKERAQNAVQYIVDQGIDPSRIKAKGYGESKPLIENATTEEEHQKNRRTEFHIVEVDE